MEGELGKVTIENQNKRQKTRNKNNRTVEKRIPEKEDDKDHTPNLLKERNYKIFDKAQNKIEDLREKVIIQSNG